MKDQEKWLVNGKLINREKFIRLTGFTPEEAYEYQKEFEEQIKK